jgi:phosphatidylserine decarboxylase
MERLVRSGFSRGSMRMVKEGYGYGLPLVLIGGGLLGFRMYWLGALFLLLALFILNFFRDPERPIPDQPEAIISPADGKVVQIQEEEAAGRPRTRISIFMSPLDVHVNRAPVSGTLTKVDYRKGSFHVASKDVASVENEQNVFVIQGEQGEVIVKQIAGLLARRIVFWKSPGDLLGRGERVGLIKFGSRVDVMVDPKVQLNVRVGDRVWAGSSILGHTQRKT